MCLNNYEINQDIRLAQIYN